MKTTMTISVDEELKKDFFNFSIEVWTNPTNLLNMLMKQTITTRELRFRTNNSLDLEIEAFNQDEINSFSSDFHKKTNENTKKLETLLAWI